MKYLLAFLLLPFSVAGQEQKPVEPVKSAAYRRLIAGDTTVTPGLRTAVDTFRLRIFAGIDQPIRRIRYHGNSIDVDVKYPRQLRLSGSYNASLSIRQAGRQPALQKTYAQGRSSADGLKWIGPASNEVFSYGPALSGLEYNGVPNAYDSKGDLVPAGQGNGVMAHPYTNSVFRTAVAFEQQFNLQARIMNYNTMAHELKLGFTNSTEKTYIRQNNNRNYGLTTSYAARIKWLLLSLKYSHAADRYDNSNRNGFLNKVYQQSLLTPPSFDNAAGYLAGSRQRSYSNQADNPYFLLADNGNYLNNTHHLASFTLKRQEYRKTRYSLIQSFEVNNSRSREAFKPYSANWPDGKLLDRETNDKSYEINGELEQTTNYGASRFSSSLNANMGLSTVWAGIHNGLLDYRYQRTATESRIAYNTKFNANNLKLVLDVGNKTYLSNTTGQHFFFLPQGSLEATLQQLAPGWDLELGLSYSEAAVERGINQSYGYANLTTLSVDRATAYFPVTEVNSFDGLKATRHRDSKISLALNSFKLGFTAYLYSKKVTDDVAPLAQGNQLSLVNIGDHRTRGIDLAVRYGNQMYPAVFSMTHELMFSAYKTKVTRAETGYNQLALYGFSDLHTAWIEGMPMNVIVGSAWTRGAGGELMIAEDGYPFPQKSLQVIGDPNPDFIVKYVNSLIYKRWTLNTSLEWKKGGEKWNGAQAILDYYGVSANSGDQRTVKGYVFDGVKTDNSKNTKPVDFYDPKQPVYENRWTRYGPSGVGEAYIQKADWLKIRDIKLSYYFTFRKGISRLETGVYLRNLLLWTPYKGVDPEQQLFDLPGSQGLDYFNLPAVKTIGCNVSIQF